MGESGGVRSAWSTTVRMADVQRLKDLEIAYGGCRSMLCSTLTQFLLRNEYCQTDREKNMDLVDRGCSLRVHEVGRRSTFVSWLT